VISLEFPFDRVRDLSTLTQPTIFETSRIGSESHFTKLAERMRAPLSTMCNTVPTAPICSFQDVVVKNKADLWITTTLAGANDEVGRGAKQLR